MKEIEIYNGFKQGPRSVSEKALLAHFFVIGRKLMLAILTIWLCLISDQCLELNQNGNSPTHS